MKTRIDVPSIAILGFVILVVVVTGYLLLRQTNPINRANFAKVQEGMTDKEVEQILGKSSGPWPFNDREGIRVDYWGRDNTLIVVLFDDDNKVKHKEFSDAKEETVLEKVRRWLGM